MLQRLGVTRRDRSSHRVHLARAFAEEERRQGGRERRITAQRAEKGLGVERWRSRRFSRSRHDSAFGVRGPLTVAIGDRARTLLLLRHGARGQRPEDHLAFFTTELTENG